MVSFVQIFAWLASTIFQKKIDLLKRRKEIPNTLTISVDSSDENPDSLTLGLFKM